MTCRNFRENMKVLTLDCTNSELWALIKHKRSCVDCTEYVNFLEKEFLKTATLEEFREHFIYVAKRSQSLNSALENDPELS